MNLIFCLKTDINIDNNTKVFDLNNKTNIVIIDSKHKWGGVATWNLAIAKGLNDKGYTVSIIARKNGVNIINYAKSIDEVYPISFGAEYNPVSIFKMYRFFKRNKVQFVIINVQKEIINAGIAARMAKCKTILRIGSVNDFQDRRKDRKLFHKYVDSIIVPCRGMRDQLKSRLPWFPANYCETIYNGKDFLADSALNERARNRENLGIWDNELVIGYIGQLSSVKRLDFLLKSIHSIKDKYKNIRVLIVGSGAELAYLKKVTFDLGLEDMAIFTGHLENIAGALSAMDIGVLTSETEGFPNTIIEYMAAGLPVLASNVGCIAEAIDHGESGFLFDRHEIIDFIKPLSRLLEDGELRKRMGEKGLELIEKNFSMKRMIESFIQLIHESNI